MMYSQAIKSTKQRNNTKRRGRKPSTHIQRQKHQNYPYTLHCQPQKPEDMERRTWKELSQALKVNNSEPRIPSFNIDGEIKVFQGKHKSRQFMTINSVWKKVLNGVCHNEEEER